MYMLGVEDATEGKAWCGYGQVDSITINHTVLTWFEQHAVKKPDVRASILIEEALVKNFPCQRTDSSIKIASRSSPILSLTPDALNLSGNDFLNFGCLVINGINSGRVSICSAWRMRQRTNCGVDTLYLRR